MKQFLCVWDKSYMGDNYKFTNDSYFNTNNGYEDAEITNINNLQVGETCEISGHVIARLQDK